DFKELESFNLPKENGKISIEKPISKFVFAEISNLKTKGVLNNFNLIFKDLNTNIGTISLNNYLTFSQRNDTSFFKPFSNDSTFIALQNFNLSELIDDRNFGIVDGKIKLQGLYTGSGAFELSDIFAKLNKFDYSNYSYSSITLNNGSLKDDIIQAKLNISDPNLSLKYDGKISIGKKQEYKVELDLEKALLGKLGFSNNENLFLSTKVTCDLKGTSLDEIKGNITANFLSYKEDSNDLNIPEFKLDLVRNKNSDIFHLRSSILNADVSGKINYETVIEDFLSELSVVFPSIDKSYKKEREKGDSDFSFDFTTGNSDEFLSIFLPDLKISASSKLIGSYNSKQSNLKIDLNSQLIQFQDLKFSNLICNQTISKIGIIGTYRLDEVRYGDSLNFDNVLFTANGMAGIVNSKLTWDPNTKDYSSIDWKTIVLDNDLLNFQLHPSFFSLNGLQWKIENESDINLSSDDVHVSNLKLSRNDQSIQINGCLSKNNSDKLKLDIDKFDLKELSQIFGLGAELGGKFSGWGEISNPYTNFNYMGDARVESFKIDNEEIGNIQIMSDWNQKRESVILNGDLEYKNQRTFDFSGMYDISADNLDLFLNFENTDITFTNAFMDPSVVKDISGKLNGNIRVKGKPSEPKLNGKLKLNQGAALVELLGVKYTIDGNITIEEDAFLIDAIPVRDEDGNTAALVGAVNHYNFEKWNFDLQFNFEDDLFKRPLSNGKAVPLEQFKVLKTKYKEGDIYYGSAYARGYANIEGTENSLSITVEAETKPNTQIFFPMYGVSELNESEDFITIIDKSIKNKVNEKKIDLSGIDLDMKFKVNQNAKMNLIFDNVTNDEITATGKGEINLKLDQMDNVFLEGTYTISEGSKYNFTMAGIQQPFEIEKGSTIKWSGSPYNADININTYVNLKKVSILELSPELMDNTLLNQEVNCYLKLDETLLKPHISFDIKAPRAPETGKALIRRVTADNDELNRQFFSLLIARKFQPLKGSISASSSAAIDLVESQINAALNKMTDNYKLNVDYGEEKTMGEKSFEVGFKKGLLDDRLIISSSIGVESKNISGDAGSSEGGASNGNGSSKSSSLIGDVNIEYIINEKGTFRANIFNKSNTNTINEQAGPFTQGAGVSYLEEFNNWSDFELVQYGLDVFRKEGKKKYRKKKKKTKIPIEVLNNSTTPSTDKKDKKRK
ncbi:MAG: translocation/assembly module TamB domain-containing protein, partial [Bacteroidota bacterium]